MQAASPVTRHRGVSAPTAAGTLQQARRLLALILLLPATMAQAQDADGQDVASETVLTGAPFIFLDCRRCDFSHIRQEIGFVNYVREPGQAQVHVLITDQQTGSGGRMYTLEFLGRNAFAGVDHRLSYTSMQSNTAATERDGLTEMLKVGLVPYVARTSLGSRLRVTITDDGTEPVSAAANDSWSNWTFEVYGGGNANVESTQTAWNARYGFYANRVTEQWKLRFRPYFNHNVRRIDRPDSEDIRTDQRRHGFESYVIRSVGPNVGAGLFAEYRTATIDNLRHGFTFTPAVEYSLFPYSEATRRQITFTYRLGYELADYFEETIFERHEDALLNQSFNASTRFREPWGSISAGLTGSRYFREGGHHRITFDSNVSFRLGHGISLNVGGTYQAINDQLALPRRGASLEDILLERTRIATSYRGSANVGLSYTFGSIFSNVVNPRF